VKINVGGLAERHTRRRQHTPDNALGLNPNHIMRAVRANAQYAHARAGF